MRTDLRHGLRLSGITTPEALRDRQLNHERMFATLVGEVARPVVRKALRLAAIGLAIGVPVAIASAQLIQRQLYGVPPHDPLVVVLGAIVLLATAPLAAWLPARRAAQVDPIITLRTE